MIDTVLDEIVKKLNTYIGGSGEPDVVLGNISLIDAYHDSSTTIQDKVIASVVNIEQERSLRNIPYRRTVTNPDGLPRGVEREPEIYLNVYVLFGANKNTYKTGLLRISQVIAFFQQKFVYTPDDLPILTSLNLERVIFDIYSTGFDELSQMWSMLGGKYIPSVVYKMRVVMIQAAEEHDAGIISEVQLKSGNVST